MAAGIARAFGADKNTWYQKRYATAGYHRGGNDRVNSPIASVASSCWHCPGLMLSSLAIALVFAPAFSTATLGVRSADAGIASAIVNTSQQVGSSVGTAFLSTMFATATATASYSSPHAHAHGLADAASIHGYSTAFESAAALLAVGLLLALLILPRDGLARAASAQTQASTEPALKAADLTPSQIHTYRAAALTASCTHAHRPVQPRRLLMANKLRRTTFRTGEFITESAVHDVLGPQIETTEAPDAKTQRAPKAEDLPPQTHPPLSRLKPLHHQSVAELLPEPINPPPAGPVIR